MFHAKTFVDLIYSLFPLNRSPPQETRGGHWSLPEGPPSTALPDTHSALERNLCDLDFMSNNLRQKLVAVAAETHRPQEVGTEEVNNRQTEYFSALSAEEQHEPEG